MSQKADAAIKMTLKTFRETFLWTFTFPHQVKSARICSIHWNHFMTLFRREFHRRGVRHVRMVRVYEVHPGGHGYHVHFIADRRLPLEIMRPLAEASGYGRIHVKRIARKNAGYIAKYIGKQSDREKGVRYWAHCGINNDEATRIKDIEIDSPVHRIYQKMRRIGLFAGQVHDKTLALFQFGFAEYLHCTGQDLIEWLVVSGWDSSRLKRAA